MSNVTPSGADAQAEADTDQFEAFEGAADDSVPGDLSNDEDAVNEPTPLTVASPRRPAVPAVRASAALAILVALFVSTWYATASPARYVVTTAPAAVTPPATNAPAPSTVKPGARAKVPTATGPAPAASVPIGNSPTGAGPAPGGSVPIGTSPSGVVPSGTAKPGSSVSIDPNSGSPIPGLSAQPLTGQAKCPLGWPAPERSGGLASMILLAPAAGPFSSEAFALGSVYQPLMQLVGPVLAEIEPVINANISWINPIIAQVQGAEAVVLEAILPFYGPYRAQFLAAEGNLAKVLAPALTRIYQSPQAACLVAWQGQIISAAKGHKIRTASLSRPGQFNVYG